MPHGLQNLSFQTRDPRTWALAVKMPSPYHRTARGTAVLSLYILWFYRINFLLSVCFTLIAQLVKNPPSMQETLVRSARLKICWRRDRLPTPVFLGFPCGSAGKESAYNAGDPSSIPGLGRSPGEGKGYPFQYSGLKNPAVYGVTKTWTQLSNFH